jgi:hypothetical protein
MPMYKAGCIKDGGKWKILKGFPKETIELSEEQPNNVHITVGMIMEWHVSISSTPF